MCRLAAFPPGFSKHDAIEILKSFEKNNDDGTGSAHVHNGQFIVKKYAKTLTKILANKPHFLGHMPYNGWTIVHLRAASHGSVSKENTHPFIAGKWCVCHNGVFSEHNLVRLCFSKQVEFDGETDSEAAAHLLNVVGPKKFAENVDWSGVFLALNTDGSLWCVKTSGDMLIHALPDDRVLIASEFPDNKYGQRTVEGIIGWYLFGPDGKYLKHKKMKDSYFHSTKPYGGCSAKDNFSECNVGNGRVDITKLGNEPTSYTYRGNSPSYYGHHIE
jgi:predicted glutamine amidotransferase